MLDIRAARDRTYRMAIVTGEMADMGLIHAEQRADGFEACFGRQESPCMHMHCKWHSSCMALVGFGGEAGSIESLRAATDPGR